MVRDSAHVYYNGKIVLDGSRTIELRNASGTVLQTQIVSIPTGTQTIYLGFPVTDDLELINNVLSADSNEKYIHEIDFAPLDLEIHRSSNIAS